ncbi:hypothetical protein Sjap_019254 [Stephania japonica]|uniref:Uncharacterized protein n=1 Tax=Stephania japonica TaxID=461633 RepID=A0AAP0HZB8_9MAGN
MELPPTTSGPARVGGLLTKREPKKERVMDETGLHVNRFGEVPREEEVRFAGNVVEPSSKMKSIEGEAQEFL